MNPIEYKPLKRSQFIGPAAKAAQALDNIIMRTQKDCSPLKILFYGDAGVGKSALVEYLLRQLDTSQWSVTRLSGTEVRLEDVQAFNARLCYRDLFSTYKVLWIDEMDRASHTARAAMLTMLDTLPDHVAILVTSNKAVDEMEKRFFTRFQAFEIKSPTSDQIRDLLKRWKNLRADAINRIAELCCGNVRHALLEAQTELDQAA
jgi:replication-associated recombination protein RarA